MIDVPNRIIIHRAGTLPEGAARITSALNIYVRPTITLQNATETHQNMRRPERALSIEGKEERGR